MSLTVTTLGTGTSAGVPLIGCECDVCTSDDPRDRRDRPGAMVEYTAPQGHTARVLIDTTPDLRHQMIRHRVNAIHGVVYTHAHADHILGIDDLRRFNAVMDVAIDIHAEADVHRYLRESFRYIFEPHRNVNPSFIPRLIPHLIDAGKGFEIQERSWRPLRLLHGRLPIVGYRVDNFAYCTDCSSIPPETWPLLEGLDVLVLGALRFRHHPTHMTIDQALEVVDQLRPRQTYFTHLSHEVSHALVDAQLPDGVNLAYDGMTVDVS